jgi:phage gpG-like protein
VDANDKTQFLLVKSVTIPARPFLGWNDDMAETCGQFIGEHAEKELDK